MKVEQLMSRTVKTCRATETLNRAAQLMWENDCGCIPVVDDDGRAVGIVTDRDVCMAAYTQGGQLDALPVATAMARDLRSCHATDTIVEAESIMRAAQVRRLPVVDAGGRLVGLLSLNDIAREVARQRGTKRKPAVGNEELAMTLAAICTPREHRDVETAA
jgi:CBS domain-containing protein